MEGRKGIVFVGFLTLTISAVLLTLPNGVPATLLGPGDASLLPPAAAAVPSHTSAIPHGLESPAPRANSGASLPLLARVDHDIACGACPSGAELESSGARLDLSLPPCLELGTLYAVPFTSVDAHGRAQCCGGDTYEVELFGGGGAGPDAPAFRGRQHVVDHSDGSYDLQLYVPADVPGLDGDFVLQVALMFSRHADLKCRGPIARGRAEFDSGKRLLPLALRPPGSCPPADDGVARRVVAPPVEECGAAPMWQAPAWHGHWLRVPSCDEPCAPPYCAAGSASVRAAMDDNAECFVYRRADCLLRLFTVPDARACLDGKWLMMHGDSNVGDMLRNLLEFTLGLGREVVDRAGFFSRRDDKEIRHAADARGPAFSARFTNRWFGATDQWTNFEGVRVFENDNFLERESDFFYADSPDYFIVNDAGLHSMYWVNCSDGLREYEHVMRNRAVPFWLSPLHTDAEIGAPSHLAYRTNVAWGYLARPNPATPTGLAALNDLVAFELMAGAAAAGRPPPGVIDFFDVTWSWHYDERTNDGGHYGCHVTHGPPHTTHFVDVMGGQALLNWVCAQPPRNRSSAAR